MTDDTPSPAAQRRHLLPRWPSDRIVWGLLLVGLLVALAVDLDPAFGLVPGALAGGLQHVSGHVRAWRSGGVERAFVMESAALAFYVVFVLLVVGSVLDLAEVVDIQIYWLAIAAMFVDTIIRSVREHKFA